MKKTWTPEEEDFLKKNYHLKSNKFLADYLNRSLISIKGKAQQLKIITYIPKKWTEFEIEFLKENYEKFGRKFVCEKLNREPSGVQKKAQKFGLRANNSILFSKETLEKAIQESYCMSNLLSNLQKTKSGNTVRVIRKYINLYNLDISHFDSFKKIREKGKKANHGNPIEHWLVNGSTISSSSLKTRLYRENLKKHECEKCGQGELWRGEKISLILDHENGISNDNRLENLRILCPNCNAALPTHCRGQKGLKPNIEQSKKTRVLKERIENNGLTEKLKESSIKQRKVDRPDYNTLIKLIEEFGYGGTGKKYGVSDNSIRKWVRTYEKYGF